MQPCGYSTLLDSDSTGVQISALSLDSPLPKPRGRSVTVSSCTMQCRRSYVIMINLPGTRREFAYVLFKLRQVSTRKFRGDYEWFWPPCDSTAVSWCESRGRRSVVVGLYAVQTGRRGHTRLIVLMPTYHTLCGISSISGPG